MRLKLSLQCAPQSRLHFNHRHALRAVIYHIIERADAEYSDWLHNRGFMATGKKNFKLFSFDLLRGQPYRTDVQRSHLVFESGRVEWTVSFYIDDQLTKFVEGLFQHQVFEVVAVDTKVRFQVQSVQILETPLFTETMRFRAETGICLTEKTESDRYEQFRSPADAHYKQLFLNSLAAKVQAATGEAPPVQKESFGQYLEENVDLKILNQPKMWSTSEPQKGSDKWIKTIGWKYDFALTAPVEWLRIGFYSGFGKLSSGGFGFVLALKS
ncbi:MAG: CRISPR-associated endoribonuclease Cas6 [Saprospiraceae bacterium]|nr:CRISPR-associated endoribonuclease Cas6 [Saprospiraceae bacterium]